MTSMDADISPKARKTKTDDKRSIKRVKRSPSRISRPFTRRYFHPRFYYRPRDDYFSRRPSFGLRLQRYTRSYNLRFPSRPHNPHVVLRHRVRSVSPSLTQRSEKQLEKRTFSTAQDKKSITPDRSRSSSSGSERPFLSFTVSQEEEVSRGREALSSVTRAAARSRAIQRKREEIEEVYRQDCDTFGVVVKMLVAKDPSLERSIQSSLKENLREIGLRCVEAMEKFIHEYDSRELSTSQSQIH